MKVIRINSALPNSEDSAPIELHARTEFAFDNGQRVRIWIDNTGRLTIASDSAIAVYPAGANMIRVEPL